MTNCLVFGLKNFPALFSSTNINFWQFNPFSVGLLLLLLGLMAFLVVIGR